MAMSEAVVTQSIRYCGALCCWHRRTVTPSLYCMSNNGRNLVIWVRGRSRSLKMVLVLERPASASRLAADVTGHDRICGYHWLGVQQHSTLVEVCLSQTSAPRLVQSYSNRGESWQRRTRVSSQTQRRVNVRRSQKKKHLAHTLETCLSRMRSDDIVTPRTRTWSLAATVSVPSCNDGPSRPNGVCPYLEPTQTSSVFSLFSLSLLADIQRLTSVRQCSSLVAANVISSR